MSEASTPAAPLPPPRQSDSQRHLLPALVRARRNFGTIERDAEGSVSDERGRRGFRYATLFAHLEAVNDALLAEGILVEQDVMTFRGDGRHIVVTKLLHAPSEEWRCGHMPVLAPHRPTAQEMGSAITYARRYGLAILLGLAVPDEPDADGGHRFTDQTEQRWEGQEQAPGAAEGDPGWTEEDERNSDAGRFRDPQEGAGEQEAPAPEAERLPADPPAPAPPPAEKPPKPPTIHGVMKALLAALRASETPAGVWLGHAEFIRNLVPSMRETAVDKYREITGEDPPSIEGVTYPAPVVDLNA